MGITNKITINFIINKSERLGRNFLSCPKKVTNIEEIKYVPQKLSEEVVEFSKKAVQQTEVSVDSTLLQEAAYKGLSLKQMASKFGISLRKLRTCLEQNNIVTDTQKEFRVLRKYFTASTEEEKAKYFSKVDKYLQKIAKERFKSQKGTMYEDCLQDVRLEFFELEQKYRKTGTIFSYGILNKIRESESVVQKRIKTVSLENIEKAKTEIPVSDVQMEVFENADFEKWFWCYLELNNTSKNKLSERNIEILKEYLKGKSKNKIAKEFNLTTERIRTILIDAIEKANEQYKYLSSK